VSSDPNDYESKGEAGCVFMVLVIPIALMFTYLLDRTDFAAWLLRPFHAH
jgi:hypothetical protein